MLLPDAVFNNFAGVFDVLNDVRQNVAVVLLFLYSIIPNLDAIIRVRNLNAIIRDRITIIPWARVGYEVIK